MSHSQGGLEARGRAAMAIFDGRGCCWVRIRVWYGSRVRDQSLEVYAVEQQVCGAFTQLTKKNTNDRRTAILSHAAV